MEFHTGQFDVLAASYSVSVRRSGMSFRDRIVVDGSRSEDNPGCDNQ
jgi:hypothetical protein